MTVRHGSMVHALDHLQGSVVQRLDIGSCLTTRISYSYCWTVRRTGIIALFEGNLTSHQTWDMCFPALVGSEKLASEEARGDIDGLL